MDGMVQNGIDSGYLIVQVYTAGKGLPVSDAHVTVSSYTENGANVERIMTTDNNGKTEKIELSAPPRANSMSPEGTNDFSRYIIQTEKEGYYSVENLEVPIFGGQTTIQQVSLIPLPFGYQRATEIFVDEEPADL